eukprot:3242934-Rhodomonas_salina.1
MSCRPLLAHTKSQTQREGVIMAAVVMAIKNRPPDVDRPPAQVVSGHVLPNQTEWVKEGVLRKLGTSALPPSLSLAVSPSSPLVSSPL